jgi:hypothetical protein
MEIKFELGVWARWILFQVLLFEAGEQVYESVVVSRKPVEAIQKYRIITFRL